MEGGEEKAKIRGKIVLGNCYPQSSPRLVTELGQPNRAHQNSSPSTTKHLMDLKAKEG